MARNVSVLISGRKKRPIGTFAQNLRAGIPNRLRFHVTCWVGLKVRDVTRAQKIDRRFQKSMTPRRTIRELDKFKKDNLSSWSRHEALFKPTPTVLSPPPCSATRRP